MKIAAEFVTSAAGATDLPRDGLAELALVGRSNVGKSSLINALVRQRVARTSAAPGKTRLANIYRVTRGTATPFYLVDLPGYGYARGRATDFSKLVADYFESRGRSKVAVLLTVDARHPGLPSDIEAWHWLNETVERAAVVVTKIDTLARGERIRAVREHESVLAHPVVPVSSATGEGLDELWILIDTLVNQERKPRRSNRKPRKAAPLCPKR